MKLEYRKDNPHNARHEILGTIIADDGEMIDLTEQAWINQAGAPAKCWYEAEAISRTKKDDEGKPVEYRVTWQIVDESAEDAENACDWDKFEVEVAVK